MMEKLAWLKELANFIVEANTKTWAAKKGKVDSIFPGMKSIYYKRGNWELRDNYFDYFKAPGTTVVSQSNKPVWMMSYFGLGQVPGQERLVKRTFSFLRKALMKIKPEMPFRGPNEYIERDWTYNFRLVKGDIEDFLWEEEILNNDKLVFAQTGGGGIGIARDFKRRPDYHWEF